MQCVLQTDRPVTTVVFGLLQNGTGRRNNVGLKPHFMFFVFESSVAKYLNVLGIVIWPFVFILHKKEDTPPSLMKHEFVHVHQIRREGIIWFYIQYLYSVFKFYWKTGDWDRGFVEENIWEDEAYSLEGNPLTEEEKAEVKWVGPGSDRQWKAQRTRQRNKANKLRNNE